MAKKPSFLEQYLSTAERILLAMPADSQARTLAAVDQIVSGTEALKEVPEGVWDVLWKALLLVAMKSQMPGSSIENELRKASDAAPTLLARLRERYGRQAAG